MVPRFAFGSALALGVLVLTTGADAQQPRQGGATTGQTPDVLPAPGGPNGPAAEPAGEEKKAPARDAAGYSYSDKPTATRAAPRSHYRAHGPVVNMPGFEPIGDGGSRLFVQLSQNVPVEERKAQGSITYVLKGASPRVWNNTNALVTVHFNTPVSRARLVPQGADLLFIVELRAAATPTWKVNEGADKTVTLAIDFPKGEYLRGGGEPAAATEAGGEPAPAGRPPSRTIRRAAPKSAPRAPKQ